MSDVCEIKLAESIGNKKDREELIKRVNDEADRRLKRDPSKPRNAHLMEAVDRIAKEESESAQRIRQQLVTQGKSRGKLNVVMDGFIETGSNPTDAVKQTIASAADAGVAAAEKAHGRFVTEAHQNNVYNFMMGLRKSPSDKKALAIELGQANTKGGKIGVTGNKMAADLAKLFQSHVDFYRGRLREFGFKVHSLEGRILAQIWDTERMLQRYADGAEFAEDYARRVSRIGDTRTSEMSTEEVKKILSDFFYERTGLVGREIEMSARNMTVERQTYAVRQALSRELHFDNPEDFLYALETSGAGDMATVMSETIRDLGKQVDMTERLGVNPRNNAAWLVEQGVNKGANRRSLTTGVHSITNLMNVADGFYDNNSANPAISQFMDTVHGFARAAYLSFSSLAAIGDFPTLAAAQRRQGIEYMTAWAMRMKSLANDFDPAMAREMAGVVETQAVHALGATHKYIGLPGVSNRLHDASVWASNKVMEKNGLSYLTRKNKQAAYLSMSNRLAGLVSKKTPYEELSNYTKRTLLRGGVSREEWARLIDLEDVVYKDGKFSFLKTEGMDPKLASRLNAVLAIVVNEAVITPDTMTRATMSLGLQRGTWGHAAVSQATFLMGYPISFINQGFRREMEANGLVSFQMLRYFTALTLAGVAYVVLRDLANGRNRDYTHPEIMVQVLQEGMLYGGGLTLYGEILWKLAGVDRKVHHLLFGENSDYRVPVNRPVGLEDFLVGAGVGYLSTVGGGTLGGLYEVVTGDIDEGLNTWTKTAQRTLPFVDLPYTKAAVDTLIFNNLIEMTDPRAIDQAERRWRARTGGDFFLTD